MVIEISPFLFLCFRDLHVYYWYRVLKEKRGPFSFFVIKDGTFSFESVVALSGVASYCQAVPFMFNFSLFICLLILGALFTGTERK